ncbi:Predicted arabinose efflux permease, MFS family [Nitrosomonas cryotolerans]|uniref:Predicted arabinose efflux permease, MFS family n=1 Tax=Nitrosomonas cryotolerans ATCC 49181 TaxID=1131553 RepID=A0A1N6IX07_9PROT|nr:MFS transporter [Nitrosomonas cryotolerans]SFP85756.1 Predicted arabinose efflux permease, MFS family [Nitrosomonas cryotolerans]SIO36564.1 Predicted arabinose efflux permease, MFS family [Nitrosomonas cryotolerans ATCC 49181]
MSTLTSPAYHTAMVNNLLRIVLVFAMTLPMLILYATSTLGPVLSLDLKFDITWLGYLIMSAFGLAAILSLWAGAIVNTIGTRYALLIIFFAITLAFTLIANTQDFYGLMIAAAICGIAQALANPVTNLLITQQIPAEKRAFMVGLKQSGVQLAALFAGLVLPGIAFQYGWRVAFGVIVPVALLFCIATLYVTPKQPTKSSQAPTRSFPNSLTQWLMSIQFCVGLSLSAFVTFLPTFAMQQGMSLSLADSLIGIFGITGMLSRIVLTPLGSKLADESRLLFILSAIAAGAIAFTMFADPEHHWCLWVGAIGVGLSAVGTNAIAMSMLIRDSAFGPVTTTSGFVSVSFFAGFALGPPLYASLANYSGSFLLGWSTLIGILMTACILTWALASARRQQETAQLSARISHSS